MATTRVQLPDGNIGEFPASMKPEEIEAVLAKQFPPESAAPGVPKAPTPAGLQGPPQNHGLMSGNAPIQQMFDEAATAPKPTSAKNVMADLGAGATRLFSPLAHPIQAVAGMAKLGKAAFDPLAATELAQEAVKPFLQNPGGEAIAAIPQVAMALAGGSKVTSAQPTGKGLLVPYRSAVIPTAEASAENLAKAILPPEGVTPNLVKAIQREAPHVREYAMRTNNPLRTIPEGMKAAEGVASEGLEHYRQNLLTPNAGERVTLENGVSPDLGHTATLGQIEKRISDINDLVRGATRTAKSGGAEMTALERQGLENEGKALRQKLYQGLSEKTGISPEDIQGMREGYGGQFALKNALESGHYNRLTRTGLQSQGAGTGIYPSKAGIVDKLITTLRGGPERIANRQFSRRMSAFEPQAPQYMSPSPRPVAPQGMASVSPEISSRIGAIGTDEGVQPRAVQPSSPLNGPIQKAPANIESERVSRLLEQQINEQAAAERAANLSTRGKRLDILAARKGLR